MFLGVLVIISSQEGWCMGIKGDENAMSTVVMSPVYIYTKEFIYLKNTSLSVTLLLTQHRSQKKPVWGSHSSAAVGIPVLLTLRDWEQGRGTTAQAQRV